VAFFKYFLIRAAVFVPLFVIFYLLGVGAIFSVVFAALIAFCVSYIFFRKQRDAATEQMRNRFSGRAKPVRTATELADADAEDSLVEAHPDVVVNSDARPKTRPAGARGEARPPGGSHPAPAAGQIPKDFLDS
jgi:mannitol-specific phosphotransferase system IIBC component